MRTQRLSVIFYTLMGIIIVLMIGNVALFFRMNQLQARVIKALEPFERTSGLEIGEKAPDFHLVSSQGDTKALADLSSSQLLIAFFSSECSKCKDMYPVIGDFTREHHDLDFAMILRGSPNAANEIAEEYGFDFLILMGNDDVFSAYKVPGTPWFFLIDETGTIMSKGGGNTIENLERIINTE
jgi:peroxiredoxin